MSRPFHPYRYLAVLLAVVLFAGTVIPANLHAAGLDFFFCFADPPVQEMAASASGMPCEGMSHEDPSGNGMDSHGESGDCKLHYSCTCSSDNAREKKKAVTHWTHSKVILPSAKGIPAQFRKVNCCWTWKSANQTASPPPIYLLNSSFLN